LPIIGVEATESGRCFLSAPFGLVETGAMWIAGSAGALVAFSASVFSTTGDSGLVSAGFSGLRICGREFPPSWPLWFHARRLHRIAGVRRSLVAPPGKVVLRTRAEVTALAWARSNRGRSVPGPATNPRPNRNARLPPVIFGPAFRGRAPGVRAPLHRWISARLFWQPAFPCPLKRESMRRVENS